MSKNDRFSPNANLVVVAVGTLYIAGQAAEWLREGHVLPETHAESLVHAPGSAPGSVAGGGAGPAIWNRSAWNRSQWG